MSGTNARIESISDFASQVQPLAGEFAEAASTELGTIAQARIGASGTSEGGGALQSHMIAGQLVAMLNNDATLGVMALATGAQTIAVNYLTADAQQQDEMDVVNGAFMPAPGKGMQSAIAEQQAAAERGDADDAPGVAVDGSDVELPEATTEGPAEPSQSSQDTDRVSENQQAYGEDENKYDGVGTPDLQTEGPPVYTSGTDYTA
ncbi:hypothetical protein [Klenkia taihuensis]|uniref:Uncharacterized protein n=1 Tax=Klenkia taihuensis TaxID=1225127 RepID=A0A1I1IMY9_9ACTN|nr:hypothetical protein [Klenkia taihuensis]GHE11337.1 hypothetical protein GCM10011381_24570 [Klenkia taihuensis]SFC37616.1 hypothetical protein SAMN05661030_0815 [Klenkia taihuensis]